MIKEIATGVYEIYSDHDTDGIDELVGTFTFSDDYRIKYPVEVLNGIVTKYARSMRG